MSNKTKISIAIGILLIVCLFALGVIILIQYSANVIVKNAANDYFLYNKDTEINTNIENDTFTKTYNVLNVADSNDEDYLYITIRQFQEEEIKTVKVQRSLADIIEVEKDYEFTFQYTDKNVNEDIKSIFDNTVLISIKKTNKQGLEQIQDSIREEKIDKYEEIKKANQDAKEEMELNQNLEEKEKYQEELKQTEQELTELVNNK